MPDPFLASGRYIVKDYLAELRQAVEGLPDGAVNWKPGGEDTNSLAVLVTHVLHSTRVWMAIAVGAPLPERNRDSEFRATAETSGELLELIDDVGGQIMSLLDSGAEVDWSGNRRDQVAAFNIGDGVPGYVPSAYALLHAVEHFSQHVGHATLTRQLWDARQAG